MKICPACNLTTTFQEDDVLQAWEVGDECSVCFEDNTIHKFLDGKTIGKHSRDKTKFQK